MMRSIWRVVIGWAVVGGWWLVAVAMEGPTAERLVRPP